MLTKIFCEIDDFMQEFEENYKKRLISDEDIKIKYNSRLSMSEVMTILVYYHGYGNRTFKDFYIKTVQKILKSYFPKLVSYNRFKYLLSQMIGSVRKVVNLNIGELKKEGLIDSVRGSL